MKNTMKKTFGSLTAKLAALLLAFGCAGSAWAVDNFYQDSENANLWHIANLDGLIAFRQSVNNKTTYSGKTVQLDADIDMTGVTWLPIGGGTTEDADTSETWQNYYFAGTFDGKGHVISNLKVALEKTNSRMSNRVGLFGFVNNGTVKGLIIQNVDLTGGYQVAPVAGHGVDTTFSDITVRGIIKIDAIGYASGLVANAYTGNVRDCVVNGTLDISGSSSDTGGIAGSGYANISDCVVVGVGDSVISGGEFTGGIKGYSGEGNVKVQRCTVSNVTVAATSCGAGGVFGCLQYGNSIIDCNVYDVTVVGNKPINSGVIGLIAGSNLGTVSSPCFIYGCSVSNSTATVNGMQTFSLCGDMNWDGESNGNGYVYFNSDKTSTVNDNTVALTSGTYSAPPESAVAGKTAVSVTYTAKSYVAEGIPVTENGNGTWTIGTPSPAASPINLGSIEMWVSSKKSASALGFEYQYDEDSDPEKIYDYYNPVVADSTIATIDTSDASVVSDGATALSYIRAISAGETTITFQISTGDYDEYNEPIFVPACFTVIVRAPDPNAPAVIGYHSYVGYTIGFATEDGETIETLTAEAVANSLTVVASGTYSEMANLKENMVAKIGNVPYLTLADAVAAVPENGAEATTITMVANTELAATVEIPANKKIVLDLNGKRITAAVNPSRTDGGHYYAIDNYGTFTIEDSSDPSTGEIVARGLQNSGGGSMTINGGTINACDNTGGAAVWNESNLVVEGGTFTGYVCINNQGNNTVTINGGDFVGGSDAYALQNNGGAAGGTIIINNANLTGNAVRGGFYLYGGTLIISNMTMNITSTAYNAIYAQGGAKVTVEAGEYRFTTATSQQMFSLYRSLSNTTLTINGGTFVSTNTAYPEKELVVFQNGGSGNYTLNVNGGTFTGPSSNWQLIWTHSTPLASGDSANVNGGTFNTNPEDSTYNWASYGVTLSPAASIVDNGNGTWTVLRQNPATGITLSCGSVLAIPAGSSTNITATLEPADATDAVVWSSSSTSSVTVDQEGNVTLLGSASAKVTATAGSVSATCRVAPLYTYTGTAQAGQYSNYNAASALNTIIGQSGKFSNSSEYESSDSSVVSFGVNSFGYPTLTTVAAGTARITVKTKQKVNNEEYVNAVYYVDLTVTPKPSITVTPSEATIEVGESATLVLTLSNVSGEINSYTSGDDCVSDPVAVEGEANTYTVRGTSSGTTTLVFYIYNNNKFTMGSCVITVLPPPMAQIGGTTYRSLAAALLAAQDGATIEILDGTWGAGAVGEMTTSEALSVRTKSLTIQAASGASPKFTSNVTLGYDDSSTRNATITVKGIAFENAQLQIGNYAQTTVENCSFTNAWLRVIESCASNYNRTDFLVDQVTIRNCTFNGTASGEPAIRVRNGGNVLITGNTIANSSHNGILLESNNTVNKQVAKTVVIQNNTINEWNAGDIAEGGRGIRADLGTMAEGSTVAITGNTFRKDPVGLDSPDFAKITNVGSGTVDLSGNDWNDMLLSQVRGNDAVYTCSVTPTFTSVITTKIPVAQIGTTEYTSLFDAAAAVNDGDTITMIADSVETKEVVFAFNGSATLDLNGHTVSANDDIWVKTGNITVVGGAGSAVTSTGYGFYVSTNSKPNSAATLTIDSDNVTVTAGTYGVVVMSGGSFNLVNGHIVSDSEAAVCGHGTATNVTINISGGSILGNGKIGVYFPPAGALNISGGTITGTTAIYQKCGTMTITGGTILGTGTAAEYEYVDSGANATGDAVVLDNCNYPNGVPSAIITGGEFKSANTNAVASYAGNGATDPVVGFIAGGIFSSDPSAYVANGYAAVALTEGEAFNAGYRYIVGKVETTDLQPAAGATDKQATYNFNVVVTNGTEVLETVTDQTITVRVDDQNSVSAITLDDFDISGVLASAVSAAGTGKENVTVDLRVSRAPVTGESVIFEVHPEAVIKVGDGDPEVVALTNDDLAEGATFSFKLYTGDSFPVGALIKIAHTSDDYGTEYFVATVADDNDGNGRYISVTVSHFSTFELTPITPEDGMVAVNINTGVQYAQLQVAINAAQDGDTVALLTNATLSASIGQQFNAGSITIDGAGHTLRQGQGTSDGSTSLYFKGDNADVSALQVTIKDIVFDGFRNRSIMTDECVTLNVTGCTFRNSDMAATGSNHVIHSLKSVVSIEDCVFEDNTVKAVINVDNNTSLTVEDCLFSNNDCGGNGVICMSASTTSALIEGNTFEDNEAGPAANAAVVYCSAPATVTGNLFKNNSVTVSGASDKEGVVVLGSAAGGSSITDNAFVGNSLGDTATNRATIWANDKKANYTFDVSGNYWEDGEAPETGTGNDIYRTGTGTMSVDSYATTYTPNASGTGAAVVTVTFVAQIGETKYGSLADAIAAVPANGTATVQMIADSAETAGSTVASGKTIVLDLNGRAISYTSAFPAAFNLIAVNGNLTVTDTSEGADGSIALVSTANLSWDYAVNMFLVGGGGSLTIEKGSYSVTTPGHGYAEYVIAASNNSGSSTVVVNGGTFTGNKIDAVVRLHDQPGRNQPLNVAVNGGDFTLNGGSDSVIWFDVQNSNSGTDNASVANLVINGGTFTSTSSSPALDLGHSVDASGLRVTVNGGAFKSNGAVIKTRELSAASIANINLAGGIYSGNVFYNDLVSATDSLNAMCANGCEVVDNPDDDTKAVYPYTIFYTGDIVYPIEGTAGVTVALAWATNNTSVVSAGAPVMLANVPYIIEALGQNGANGMPLWQSYVLGLAPADPNATFHLSAGPVAGDSTKVSVAGAVDTSKFANLPNVTITFRLTERSADGTWTPVTGCTDSASPAFAVPLESVAGKVLSIFADIVVE